MKKKLNMQFAIVLFIILVSVFSGFVSLHAKINMLNLLSLYEDSSEFIEFKKEIGITQDICRYAENDLSKKGIDRHYYMRDTYRNDEKKISFKFIYGKLASIIMLKDFVGGLPHDISFKTGHVETKQKLLGKGDIFISQTYSENESVISLHNQTYIMNCFFSKPEEIMTRIEISVPDIISLMPSGNVLNYSSHLDGDRIIELIGGPQMTELFMNICSELKYKYTIGETAVTDKYRGIDFLVMWGVMYQVTFSIANPSQKVYAFNGKLPFGLSFHDDADDLERKLCKPVETDEYKGYRINRYPLKNLDVNITLVESEWAKREFITDIRVNPNEDTARKYQQASQDRKNIYTPAIGPARTIQQSEELFELEKRKHRDRFISRSSWITENKKDVCVTQSEPDISKYKKFMILVKLGPGDWAYWVIIAPREPFESEIEEVADNIGMPSKYSDSKTYRRQGGMRIMKYDEKYIRSFKNRLKLEADLNGYQTWGCSYSGDWILHLPKK